MSSRSTSKVRQEENADFLFEDQKPGWALQATCFSALFYSLPSHPPAFLILGVKENSIDSLVFDTLIPKPIIQRYLNLLMEHRRIILSGPSGTGKSFLAAKLAEYIISQMGQEMTEHNVASFNVDQNSSKVRRPIQDGSLGSSVSFDSDSSLL